MSFLMCIALSILIGAAFMFILAFIYSFTNSYDKLWDCLEIGLKASIAGMVLMLVDTIVLWLMTIYS